MEYIHSHIHIKHMNHIRWSKIFNALWKNITIHTYGTLLLLDWIHQNIVKKMYVANKNIKKERIFANNCCGKKGRTQKSTKQCCIGWELKATYKICIVDNVFMLLLYFKKIMKHNFKLHPFHFFSIKLNAFATIEKPHHRCEGFDEKQFP